jgi:hypothetical protein
MPEVHGFQATYTVTCTSTGSTSQNPSASQTFQGTYNHECADKFLGGLTFDPVTLSADADSETVPLLTLPSIAASQAQCADNGFAYVLTGDVAAPNPTVVVNPGD